MPIKDAILENFKERFYELEKLGFESLRNFPNQSGIYVGWLDNAVLYIGKSDSIKERIQSHYCGSRGSDQFCLYVYDKYIHQERVSNITQEINIQTGNWIRAQVTFNYIMCTDNLVDIEKGLRRIMFPILNPIPQVTQNLA